jgi:hypothetical protein
MTLKKKASKDRSVRRLGGVTSVELWVPRDRKRPSSRSGKVKRIRNPWTPDDIIILVKFVCSYEASKYLFRLIKLWMEYRNAQRIEIRAGDYELKIEGAVSDKVIEKRITQFRELISGATYDDIEVAIPKGARRTIPSKLAREKNRD